MARKERTKIKIPKEDAKIIQDNYKALRGAFNLLRAPLIHGEPDVIAKALALARNQSNGRIDKHRFYHSTYGGYDKEEVKKE